MVWKNKFRRLMRMCYLVIGGLFAMAMGAGAMEKVIFDTDTGGDIDDAGALAVLHALADRGEVEILAVGISNGHPNAVAYIHTINAWYGRPELPIGAVREKDAPYSSDRYMAGVAALDPEAMKPEDVPDAAVLFRRILAAQPDSSVILVTVGPATNIARLLESKPDDISPLNGHELVRRKVKFYAAGGNGDGMLPGGRCGFNYRKDVVAARKELTLMPVEIPMVYAGGNGRELRIGNCYRGVPATHLIRRSYEAYFEGKDNMDRPTWDQLRVLYACRPSSRALFETSSPGDISLGEKFHLSWSKSPNRNKSYAYVRDFESVRKQITELMMASPKAVR